MAFPTIPTSGAGRVLGLNQTGTTATRTFPNLSGLTKNSGDLLIAIIVAYQTGTGTNAAFSGWTAGWTEFHDSATSTTMAVGMAYKWSTGSETGAITVTQAGTITGDASMILLSIPGAHASTPPEAGSRASSTAGTANPASFNPTGWDVADTLWIAVGGCGETAITSTWTGIASAPTNYTNYFDTATPDNSLVGQVEAAVAFRQLSAASEDVGAFTSDTSNSRDAAVVIAVLNAPVTLFGITALPITFTKAVAGIAIPTPKTTPVAEISLASHGVPSERTNHTIKIRARTTTGSTGVIKAALYEGSTNRSGDLTSVALTTSLTDYTLTIPDASAANITDYSNLSLKIWGYDSVGNNLVFEVANVYLQLPTAGGGTTYYGATSSAITFGKAVSGIRHTLTPVAEISLASHGTPSERTYHTIKIRARTTTGSSGVIKAALYEGSTNRSGDLTSGTLTTSLTEYSLSIPDASAANITDYSNLSIKIWGQDSLGTALVFEVANAYLELPVAGAATYFGATAMPVGFGSTTAAQRKTFSATALPITFSKAVDGYRKTFSATALPITFSKAVDGYRKTFSATALPITFSKAVGGYRKTFSITATSITFGAVVAGNKTSTTYFGITQSSITFGSVIAAQRKTFSTTVLPITFTKDVGGYRKTFGVIALPITFGKDVRGYRKTFGQLLSPYVFGKNVVGYRKTFSATAFPITFASTTAGNRLGITYFGVVARPITFGAVTTGQRRAFSQVVFPITFGKDVAGQRRAFAQIAFPITFGKAALGTEISYGVTSLGVIFGKEVAGRRRTFSQSVMPIVFGKDVVGRLKTFSSTAFPIGISIQVVGVTQGNSYGSTSMSVIFGKDVSAQRKTFGQLLSPYIFAATTQGKRRTASQIVLPITFTKDVSGQRKTFGQVARPIGITIVVAGSGSTPAGTYYGIVSRSIIFEKDVRARRKTFSLIDFDENLVFDVETGRIDTRGQIIFPITFHVNVDSRIIDPGVVLNLAENVYLGEEQVVAVYADGQLVWSLV